MRYRSFFLTALILAVTFTRAAADSWVQIGPLARTAQSAAIDPDDPNSIFAGFVSFGARLYHSSDGGDGWSLLTPPNFAITFAPGNHDVAYAFGGYEIFKSVDHGINWARQSTLRTGTLSVDPNDENHLYAGSSDTMGLAQFCVSTDGGLTWTCTRPDGWVGGWPSSIVIDPRDGDTAYVAMAGDFDNPSSGIYKTVDGGATWVNVSQAWFYAEVQCLAMNPSNPDVLFAGTIFGGFYAMGVFKTTDAGATWVPSSAGIPDYTEVTDLAVDPLRPDTVYAAAGVLYRSIDAGTHWTGVFNAADCGGVDLVASNPDVICANTATGIYLSHDAGGHFAQLGAPPVDMVSVLVDYTNSNVLYAAGDAGWRSTDRGAHWTPLSIYRGRAIAQDPTRPLVFYYGCFDLGVNIPNSSIWKSSTPALWFTPVLRDVAVNDIEVARTDANVVYAGGYQRAGLGGIFRSVDAGAHWTTVSSLQANALAIDPADASVVYLAGDAGMYKTADGGTVWVPITNGLDQPASGRVLEVEVDPTHPQTIYGSTEAEGLFKSDDGGASWVRLPGPVNNCRGIAIDPTDGRIVYASSWNGAVYVTVNGGETWHALGASMAGGECLLVDPNDRNTLYSVLDGIWRYERTTQCARPEVGSHAPDVIDLSDCDSCVLRFGIDTGDDYSRVEAIALEHVVDGDWVQVDEIPHVVTPPIWELEYDIHPEDAPGEHSFRCVARAVDGARAVSEAVAVSFQPGPLPTAFSRVEWVFEAGHVVLSWGVVDALDVDGFNVYRQDAANPLRRLNVALLDRDARQFTDDTVVAGTTCTYRVGAVAGDGEWLSAPVAASIPAHGLALGQNHPNPFNPTTTVDYTLPVPERVAITIYDANGALVARLDQGFQSAGTHHVQWNGKDSLGRAVASGVYFYRLESSSVVGARKMTLLK